MNFTYKLWFFKKSLGMKFFLAGVHYFRLLEYSIVYDCLNLKKGHKILDSGSGYINYFTMFLMNTNKYEVHAIDSQPLDRNTIKKLQKQFKKLGLNSGKIFNHVRSMDMRSLAFEDEYFDRIYVVSSIEHLKGDNEDSKAIEELSRVLKKKGRLIITVPFVKDHHVENINMYNIDGYEQRIYSYESLMDRIIKPSELEFEKAIHFGEINSDIGRFWAKSSSDFKHKFGWLFTLFYQFLWRKSAEYKINFDPPDIDFEKYGVICAVLKKS